MVDNCNLNCKGCAHFSNICDKNYVEVEQFERDLINDDIFRKIETIRSFHTRLTDEKKDGDFSANKSCSGRFCRFINDGKISKCYLPLLIEILNKKYGKKFEVSEKDYILLDDIKDGWDTIDKLNGDIPFCQYCRDELYVRMEVIIYSSTFPFKIV